VKKGNLVKCLQLLVLLSPITCNSVPSEPISDYTFDVELVNNVTTSRIKCRKASGLDSLTTKHITKETV